MLLFMLLYVPFEYRGVLDPGVEHVKEHTYQYNSHYLHENRVRTENEDYEDGASSRDLHGKTSFRCTPNIPYEMA